MQELSCYMGQEEVYEQSSELLRKYLRVSVPAKQIERLCNTYGEAIETSLYEEGLDEQVQEEVYAMADGSMVFTREEGWKEVKLGRIFAPEAHYQASTNRNGITHSTYVADFTSLHSFTDKMESCIPTRSHLIFLADGAKWIWNWVSSTYPQATQILDFYHAKEHACEFAALQFLDQAQRKQWIDQAETYLKEDQLDLLLETLLHLKTQTPKAEKARKNLISYYWNNYERMQYKTFRENGWLIGSGPIESAHRTVIQKRFKRAGQRWIRHNAQKVMNLRAANLSDKWDLLIQTFRNAA